MTGDYVGAVNLEAMAEAHNYNAVLADLVARNLGGCTRCLDFGAGDGLMTALVAARGIRPDCVEPDHRLATKLRAAGFAVWADIVDCPPASFDGVYTLNVLEHIEDDVAALKRLRECLVPGGRLVAYVPAFPVLFSRMDELVGHFRRYRHAELAAKLRAAGFVVDQLAYADSLGFFAALAYRFVARGSGALKPGSVSLYDRWIFPTSHRLDRLTGAWFGKNLFAVASVPK